MGVHVGLLILRVDQGGRKLLPGIKNEVFMRRKFLHFAGLLLLSLCTPLPSLAIDCPQRILSQTPAHFGPWPGPQFLRIVQKPGSYGTCDAVAEVVAGGELRATYTETAQNSIPGTAAYDFKLLHLIPGPNDQLATYGWSTGGDSGSSSYAIYGYRDGAMRRVFSASEMDGTLSVQIRDGVLTLAGFRSTKCMACGYSASASWRWNREFGGWELLPGPKAEDFARYLNAPDLLENNGKGNLHDQALQEYNEVTRQLTERYDALMHQANLAQKQKLRSSEIQWIIEKRKHCGESQEALKPGQGISLQCLISQTRNRLMVLSSGLNGL